MKLPRSYCLNYQHYQIDLGRSTPIFKYRVILPKMRFMIPTGTANFFIKNTNNLEDFGYLDLVINNVILAMLSSLRVIMKFFKYIIFIRLRVNNKVKKLHICKNYGKKSYFFLIFG